MSHGARSEPGSFTRFPNWIFDSDLLPELRGAPVAVLLVIAKHLPGNKWSGSYPSIARISKLTGYRERQVSNAIKELKEKGVIAVESGGGRRNNRYRILGPPCPDMATPELHCRGTQNHSAGRP